MEPLGFTLEQMSAAIRNIRPSAARRNVTEIDAARERLSAILVTPPVRREKLVRQLSMADEFIGLLDANLHGRRAEASGRSSGSRPSGLQRPPNGQFDVGDELHQEVRTRVMVSPWSANRMTMVNSSP